MIRPSLLGMAATLSAVLLPAQHDISLRVLYAGDKDTERTSTWLEFLSNRTGGARFVDRESLRARDAEGADVLVVDGDSVERARRSRPDHLPNVVEFAQLAGMPTVLVGGVGSLVGAHLRLKASSFFG